MTKLCSVDGCERPHIAKGYCSMHWQRAKLYGEPGEADPRERKRGMDVEELSEWLIAKTEPSDGCLLFQGARNGCGYAIVIYEGRSVLAHRVVAEAHLGERADGHEVRHSCHRGGEGCINPRHLSYGTRRDNVRDMLKARRHPNQRLSYEKASAIRAEYAQGGVTQRELGERYGVARGTIGKIVRGRRYSV